MTDGYLVFRLISGKLHHVECETCHRDTVKVADHTYECPKCKATYTVKE